MRFLLLTIPIFVLFFSCQPEQEILTFDASVKLRFSSDTVLFDTLFTSIGSTTKRLKVFNDSDKAIEINEISIRGGSSSPYTIYVNGVAGDEFANVKLLGKDSMLVLVEVIIDPANSNLPFIVTDEIDFSTNGNQQDVKLVAWGQDAIFYNGEVLSCNTTWTADRPHVIFNSVLVDSLCTLTIDPGAKIYSHNNSFVFVAGTLEVNGTAQERVIFSNDRFDEGFENAPGQWGGIIFLPGTKSNLIEHTDIRNAQFGIYLGSPDEDDIPDLVIGNSRIENIGGSEIFTGNLINVSPGYGILAITSDLYAYNTLVNNCAISSVANLAGGNYRYEHCTFANFSFDFFRQDATMVLSDNIVFSDNSAIINDISVDLSNCIIWGNLPEEILISDGGGAQFDLAMASNIIKTQDNTLNINGNKLNENPKFFDAREYDYSLDTLSPAKDNGVDLGILFDLEGKTRDNKPDIGAFERIEN